jgi:molybdopterin-containing oxidoreductase family iron-sulfur binding subunit
MPSIDSNHVQPNNELWRSLEELNTTLETDQLFREFPQGASIWNDLDNPVSRRRFLQLMGASAALAGITACTKMPAEKIIPYIVTPENLTPGKPQFYATACSFQGYAKGILAESHEGRPTKLEGNPKHPSILGKSDIFTQSEILSLYDPDRVKAVYHHGQISTWDEFTKLILTESSKWNSRQGAGVRILTNHLTSPTLLNDLSNFLKLYPKARWHSYDPIHEQFTRQASQIVFGKEVKPLYDFREAKVILSLDHDFLGPGPAREKYTKEFMSRRKLGRGSTPDEFNRLYSIETSISITGASADHRWPIKPSELQHRVKQLAILLRLPQIRYNTPSSLMPAWLKEIASDLQTHSGKCLIVAGEQQNPEIQALAFALNDHLGNIGKTLHFIPFDDPSVSHRPGTIEDLVHEMSQNQVEALFIVGANPVYDTGATLEFKKQFAKVPFRVKMGTYRDETADLSHWHLPESHFLEAWADLRSFDGTVSMQQPLISPLYQTRSGIELFSILTGTPGRSDSQAIREFWKGKIESLTENFNSAFDQILHNGFIAGTHFPPLSVTPRTDWIKAIQLESEKPSGTSPQVLEAVFRPDFTIWDGRYSNNGWLQELPKPILQLAWDNIIAVSPKTAQQLSLNDEDYVEIGIENRQEKGMILRVPGHPDGSITLYFGYGRSRSGATGSHSGYNAYLLQNHRSPFFSAQVQLKKLGTRGELATVHTHSQMEGREIIIHSELEKLKTDPHQIVKEQQKKKPPTLLSDPEYINEAWAMVIDLTTCIGCKSCTIACQAENNIPIVGKDEVRRSREMHWIRVDRYFLGQASNPKVLFQPVPCMHCEKAPCEVVCPTVATNHSSDGLNQMIYNRCVGTRYCSNNCPYKVRRFNFFQYSNKKESTLTLMQNPNVTVRSRGVMEKCTYCVQRIQTIRIEAEKEDRPVRDLEILTACQQACPTDSIVFGNQNDKKSQVSELKCLPHHYKLLNELGTEPRTTYLALIRNPNRKIKQEGYL